MREPALVIWEGVVPYLTEAAVRSTASRLAAGLDPRSLVAFDFVGKRFAAAQNVSEKDRETRDYVGELGEPIRYGSDDVLPMLYEGAASAGCAIIRNWNEVHSYVLLLIVSIVGALPALPIYPMLLKLVSRM